MRKIPLKKISIFIYSILATIAIFYLALSGRIYQNISVAGINLSFLRPEEAIVQLSSNTQTPEKVLLNYKDKTFEIETKTILDSVDYTASVDAAYNITRTGNPIYDFATRTSLLFKGKSLGLIINLNEEKLTEILNGISADIGEASIEPSVRLSNNNLIIDPGKKGSELDQVTARTAIGQTLAFSLTSSIGLEVREIDPTLTADETEALRTRLTNLLDKSLKLQFENYNFDYKDSSLIGFIDPKGEYLEAKVLSAVNSVSTTINRPPQNSVFVFEGGKVAEFAPAVDGLEVRTELLKDIFLGNLRTLESSPEKLVTVEIPVTKTQPKVKMEDVNNLGINELIGRGTSRFAGSIPGRIHNVSLASSRFKGILVSPGETFSFNQVLGDVSALTGYKQAYIIQDGKTVLGDGGGVCQVSTTLFRAVLNAGLPIIERRAHSYRVGYYEQGSPPGLDATVYSPTTDFKFKNDTPAHILIQPTFDAKLLTLAFEIYGTDDGRVATTTKPVVSSVIAPAEDRYQDDPTLPTGVVKQVEHRANGAKVTFNYKVEKDGQTLFSKTFVSSYQPWQAVYLRGTGPVN